MWRWGEPAWIDDLECFVPDLGRFDRGQCVRTLALADDDVRLEASRHDPVGQVVDSSVIRLAPDATSVLPVRLRYAWPSELDLMARLAGLELKQRNGGWAEEAFTAASTFHVSTYGR